MAEKFKENKNILEEANEVRKRKIQRLLPVRKSSRESLTREEKVEDKWKEYLGNFGMGTKM